ncbi:MAG: nucleoside recognition protein [Firmicutes bacterium]|nr:nucleoside recognition protein [Bacillota bacterium]
MFNELAQPVKIGLQKSVQILWLLVKIITPVSCVIVVMDYFNIMEAIASFSAPVMALTGLPGEAAIALALGFFLNIYAAIGAINALPLGTQEITILAVILGISHELPIETAICRHTGLRAPISFFLRLAAALTAGIFLNHIIFKFMGV